MGKWGFGGDCEAHPLAQQLREKRDLIAVCTYYVFK